MNSVWRWAVVFFCLVVGGDTAVGQEQGYPQPVDNYLNNFSGLVLAEDERTALVTLLTDVRRDHDIEMTVVIVDSYVNYGTGDGSIESFATNLFNAWGVGNAERNDGVMILLALAEREVRIELGSGYDSAMDREMGVVLSEFVLPRFREGEFGRGLYRGVLAAIFEVTGELPADVLAEMQTTTAVEDRPNSGAISVSPAFSEDGEYDLNELSGIVAGLPIWITTILGFFGMIGLTIRRVWRNYARDCSECGSAMVKLDEVSDDAYLDAGQQREEAIKSINYDVWMCRTCGEHEIQPRIRWFSGYSRCPECNYRTLKTTSQTVQSATYHSTGQRRISKECRMCSYYDVDYVIIPKKTKSSSSSSSGSSFGGGSSSGGGASGSW
ncbi:MAG: TPM domain-containing protein [Sphaerospermopsis sp. SIO1G2]|nr:TPM domain-containing protein [Sphaerospermopsis sp. SIO1G2]